MVLFGSTVWFLFITRQQLAGCKALSKAVQTQLKKAKHQWCAAKQRDIKMDHTVLSSTTWKSSLPWSHVLLNATMCSPHPTDRADQKGLMPDQQLHSNRRWFSLPVAVGLDGSDLLRVVLQGGNGKNTAFCLLKITTDHADNEWVA